MTRLNFKEGAVKACFICCIITGTTYASDSAQDTWRTWPGSSVGEKDATFFAIDHKWYGIQITCYKESESMASSAVEVYYEGRGFDDYKIAINNHVYEGPISSDSRIGTVEFNRFLDDLRTGKPITIIDSAASATISNKNASIIPDPFGKGACYPSM